MIRQFLIIALLAATLVTGKPHVLDGKDHTHDHTAADHTHDHTAADHDHTAADHTHDTAAAASEIKVMEPKIMEPKVMEPKVMEPKVMEPKVMPTKVMEGKSVDSKSSDNKASSVNDGGRLLSLPEADACATRPKQWERNGHWYFLSTNVSQYQDIKSDWLDARNLCRKHCMDAISIETVEENDMVLQILEKEKLPYVWTSGRLCNFAGCDREDLQPVLINGWFWSGSGVKLAKTNETPAGWGYQPWSATGHFKRPQPDNAEFEINETKESCLGVLNNVYKDGIKWHDIGCYHTKAVICEDSPPLLQYIAATNPGIKL